MIKFPFAVAIKKHTPSSVTVQNKLKSSVMPYMTGIIYEYFVYTEINGYRLRYKQMPDSKRKHSFVLNAYNSVLLACCRLKRKQGKSTLWLHYAKEIIVFFIGVKLLFL
jgi:hypothetical protein